MYWILPNELETRDYFYNNLPTAGVRHVWASQHVLSGSGIQMDGAQVVPLWAQAVLAIIRAVLVAVNAPHGTAFHHYVTKTASMTAATNPTVQTLSNRGEASH